MPYNSVHTAFCVPPHILHLQLCSHSFCVPQWSSYHFAVCGEFGEFVGLQGSVPGLGFVQGCAEQRLASVVN